MAPSGARLLARRAVALLVGLVLGEGLLRAVVWLDVTLARPPGYDFGSETLARVVYAYSKGRYSVLPIGRHDMVHDARRGYRHAAGLRDSELRGSSVSTNSHGVRGVREYAVPKPTAVRRIVALGDSQTFGEGLPDDATWPAQLERSLSDTEVANLGERGYAHDQMYFALLDDGLPLRPDVVVLGLFEGDVVRDALTFYAYEKPRFSRIGGEWRVENVPVPAPTEVRNLWLATPLLYSVPRGLLELYRSRATRQRGEDRAREVVERMRLAAQNAGARFIVVNLPVHTDDTEGHTFFRVYCSTTGAECVDPSLLFASVAGTDDPARLRERYHQAHNIHYSAAGCAVIAEAIRSHLASRPVAP